jgi:hypothetical protein
MSRKVTAKQAVTAAIVRESVKAGVPLSRDLLLTAHVEGYELSPTGDKSARQVASAYVTRNMRSPEFMAEVGLESKHGKTFIDQILVHDINGTNYENCEKEDTQANQPFSLGRHHRTTDCSMQPATIVNRRLHQLLGKGHVPRQRS